AVEPCTNVNEYREPCAALRFRHSGGVQFARRRWIRLPPIRLPSPAGGSRCPRRLRVAHPKSISLFRAPPSPEALRASTSPASGRGELQSSTASIQQPV